MKLCEGGSGQDWIVAVPLPYLIMDKRAVIDKKEKPYGRSEIGKKCIS